jgi:UPF0716 protein FxsA
MWVAIALLAWPLVEIGLFVTVGGAIGLWWTLAVVLGTGVLGGVILRNAARMTGGAGLRDPRQMVLTAARGGMTLAAGVLLILPGFLTDALGLILLIPPVQVLVVSLLARRVTMATAGVRPSGRATGREDVIEGDFERVEPVDAQKPSKWTDS